MAKIAKQLTELIGHTPLLELTNYEKALGLEAKIIAKLEYFNPLGSVKDRVAAAMIEQGIKDGKINQDTIIIEPVSYTHLDVYKRQEYSSNYILPAIIFLVARI